MKVILIRLRGHNKNYFCLVPLSLTPGRREYGAISTQGTPLGIFVSERKLIVNKEAKVTKKVVKNTTFFAFDDLVNRCVH